MSTKDLWALLWHPNAERAHVKPLDLLLSLNRQRYTANEPTTEWAPIHVGTRLECEQAAEAIRPTMEKRAKETKFYADVAEVLGQ